MIGFYEIPFGMVCSFVFLGFLAVLLEGAATVVCVLEWKKSALYLAELLAEAAGLMSTFAAFLLLSQALAGIRAGLILPSGYVWIRWASFAFCAVFTAAGVYQKGSNEGILLTAAAFAMTPLSEKLVGDRFPVFIGFSFAVWYFHAIRQIIRRVKNTINGITSLSVKEAMESIPTAVLFYRRDGRVIFQNRKMTSLEFAMFGKPERDGTVVLDRIQNGRVHSQCTELERGSHAVYRLQDGTVWLFSTADVHIPRCDCVQLSAHNITAHWNAGEELERENAVLRKKGEELKEGISRLAEACMEEERQRTRNRVHDVLGQNVSILLRAIRQHDIPEQSVFEAFAHGLPRTLLEAEEKASALDDLDVLQKTMAAIGVEVIFKGVFQAPEQVLRLVSEISTEAVTNAVRHGLAQQVEIHFRKEREGFRLRIRDDGMGCTDAPCEGGGLSSMRKKLDEIGGRMEIEWEGFFALTAWMPGEKDKSDTGIVGG